MSFLCCVAPKHAFIYTHIYKEIAVTEKSANEGMDQDAQRGILGLIQRQQQCLGEPNIVKLLQDDNKECPPKE